MHSRHLSFATSLVALTIQISIFLNALMHPEQNVNFIYNVAITIFFVEFLSIHSSMMIGGAALSKQPAYKYFLLLVYLFFIGMLVSITKSYIPVLFFVLGLIGKVTSPARKVLFNLYPVLALFASLFLVMIFEGVLHRFFAMPESVVALKPGGSGTFIDTPETLLAWGIIYYFLIIIGEVWRTVRGGSLPTDMDENS